jgi:hypothetical protein
VTPAPATLVEALGWTATAAFVGSYFFTRAATLVRVQMAGAALWVVYGLLVQARPVVAANALVILAAAWKAWRPTPPSAPAPARSPPPRGPARPPAPPPSCA